ncbi:MAG: CRISPR-associated protein Cas4 [Ammonifex sp.]|jgi:CRISPR-associated exonuclease Cas4|nr:MAG: CRISPR-associated protein Cas4 [Ammonifex sp.]
MILKVSDIKQYLYCPRVIFFSYVAPVEKKVTTKMNVGKEEHFTTARLEERRRLRAYGLASGERRFNAYLRSVRLGLEGVLDMYIATPRGDFPVDFKNACRVALNHKYQLVAYALLLEDHFARPVRGGFIYLIPYKRAHYIELTPDARLYTRRLIGAVRNLVAREHFPAAPRRWGRCADCEYRNYCGDVG